MKKLNLGCGRIKMEDCLNVDVDPSCKPDIVHDLNIFPYPFSANEFGKIYMDHVIEHLRDPLEVLAELARISTDNCEIVIKCPHFSCNWLHPGHESAISTYLFDFFADVNATQCPGVAFKVEKISLFWLRNRKDYLVGRIFFVRMLNTIINFFANLNVRMAERIWCYWVGGFEEIYFKVRISKR